MGRVVRALPGLRILVLVGALVQGWAPAVEAGLSKPTTPGPAGYDQALGMLRAAYGLTKQFPDPEAVQRAPAFRRDTIKEALVQAAQAVVALPGGEHKDYASGYYTLVEGKLWPGLWAREGTRLAAEAKAKQAYTLLRQASLKIFSGKDPAGIREWGERYQKALVDLQTVRDLWGEVLVLDPAFDESSYVHADRARRDLGGQAAARQREMMDAVVAHLRRWQQTSRDQLERLRARNLPNPQVVEETAAQVLYGEVVGVPQELQDELVAGSAEAVAFVEQATAGRAEALEAEIAARQAPADAYAGDDREALRALLAEAWRQRYPQDSVRAVRLDVPDWQRTVNWRWSSAESAYYRVDTSVLVGHVLVARDATRIDIYPAYVNRDNLTGEQGPGVDTKGGGHVVRTMLAANFH